MSLLNKTFELTCVHVFRNDDSAEIRRMASTKQPNNTHNPVQLRPFASHIERLTHLARALTLLENWGLSVRTCFVQASLLRKHDHDRPDRQ
jgi:hypothetical protein